jgi:glycosyltransferase involved in cell wall biosynthesis
MRSVIHVLDNLAAGGCQTCVRVFANVKSKPRRHYYLSLRTVSKQIEIAAPDVFIASSKHRYSPLSFGLFWRLARDAEPTILHCYLFKAQIFGLIIRKLRPNTKLIFHEGGRVVISENEPWWEPILFRWFLRMAAPSVDLFVANSRYTLSCLCRFPQVRRRPAKVVYNGIVENIGVPSEEERIAARLALGLPRDAFVFGFAGRIIERKGWRDFAECAAHNSLKHDVYWIVAGGGDEEKQLNQLKADRKLSKLILLGVKLDMSTFYRSLDVCVVPSLHEPHGLVQIEAQSYGVAVIASNVPGMNETLENGINALLFPPGDVKRLCELAKIIHTDIRLRLALQKEALENAKRFTSQSYHDGLEACYEAL